MRSRRESCAPIVGIGASVDQRGNRTTMSYDALNRLSQVQDAALGLTTSVYDAASNVIATVDQRGNRATFSYDALNRRTEALDAAQGRATTVYDAASNVIATDVAKIADPIRK